MMKPNHILSIICIGLSFFVTNANLAKTVTILHTNDWQSNLLGHGPNSEYSPNSLNDDNTIGGIARLSTLIKDKKNEHNSKGPVLLLDGGDITMGTLFHTIAPQSGYELQIMKRIGYDAAAIGNHEFDYRSQGLANMIKSAQDGAGSPVLLASNLQFNDDDSSDDSLAELMDGPILKRYHIIEKDGIKFGLFGLMGKTAGEFVYPNDPIVKFQDIKESASNMVNFLINEKKVDIVILLSHCGIKRNEDGIWDGEEVELAETVQGIDVIIGGHSHTTLFDPIRVNNTIIVQAGAYGEHLGELILDIDNDNVNLTSYKLLDVNDSLIGDPIIDDLVNNAKQQINEQVLNTRNYQLDQQIAEISTDLGRHYDEYILSNLITDALRSAAQADIALTSNGMIRANLQKGNTGIQSVADFFRITPLGLGINDDLPGYPLIKVYITAKELKSILESMLFIQEIKGASYYPRVSGIKFYYNSLRAPLDKIWDIQLMNQEGDSVSMNLNDEETLYSITVTSYVGSFLNVITRDSFGLLKIVPKTVAGDVVKDIITTIIDNDSNLDGVQEIKEWEALLNYAANFPDTNNNGIADIPTVGIISEPRMLASQAFSITELTTHTTYIMWCFLGLILLTIISLGILIRKLIGKLR